MLFENIFFSIFNCHFNQAGQGTTGTDEIEFIRILCSRNFKQLNETFKAYNELANTDIQIAIKKEFSGQLELALLAIGFLK